MTLQYTYLDTYLLLLHTILTGLTYFDSRLNSSQRKRDGVGVCTGCFLWTITVALLARNGSILHWLCTNAGLVTDNSKLLLLSLLHHTGHTWHYTATNTSPHSSSLPFCFSLLTGSELWSPRTFQTRDLLISSCWVPHPHSALNPLR